MKKVFTIFTLTVLIICSAFSFDFGGSVGAGLKIGNPNGWSGGFYESWGFTGDSLKENTGTLTVQIFAGYKNFIFGLGPTEFFNRDSSNPDTTIPDTKVSIGYNFDLHTLITPSVFVEYTTNNTLSVSIVAMFNWYPHKHDYKTIDYKTTTCKEDGYKTYECTCCGKIYTERLYTTFENHNYEKIEHIDSTCAETGCDTFRCVDCGSTYTTTLPRKNHNYEEIDYKNSTCTSSGYARYKCLDCGYTYMETLPPIHSFYWEPSSIWIDYYRQKCSKCGKYSGKIKDHGKIYSL